MITKSIKQKRGVSLIVSYVLLVTLAITLAGLVYAWLRFYVKNGEEIKCPEGVSLVIEDYTYHGKILNITLKNRGLFTVGGFVVRVNDRPQATIGAYKIDEYNGEIKPQEKINRWYNLSNCLSVGHDCSKIKEPDSLTFIEVQPFIFKNNEKFFCEKVATQEL